MRCSLPKRQLIQEALDEGSQHLAAACPGWGWGTPVVGPRTPPATWATAAAVISLLVPGQPSEQRVGSTLGSCPGSLLTQHLLL